MPTEPLAQNRSNQSLPQIQELHTPAEVSLLQQRRETVRRSWFREPACSAIARSTPSPRRGRGPPHLEALVPEPPVERLVRPILPRLRRVDQGRLDLRLGQPAQDRSRHELRPVVRREIEGWLLARLPASKGPRSRGMNECSAPRRSPDTPACARRSPSGRGFGFRFSLKHRQGSARCWSRSWGPASPRRARRGHCARPLRRATAGAPCFGAARRRAR